jgi:CDGSH-type Zn-finger protein
MSDVSIRIRDNGPFLVEGSFKLLDGEGNPISLDADKPAFALCRCGASANKPFCDGSHKGCDFQAETRATEA